MVLTYLKRHLCNTEKREDLIESTGVVPVKYPPKVKWGNFYNSRVSELGENYAYLDLWEFWGFYSSIGLTLAPWLRRCFLVGKILFNSHILQNPFLIGVFLIRVYRRVQGIFIRGAQVKDMLDPSRIPLTLVNCIPSIIYFVYAF